MEVAGEHEDHPATPLRAQAEGFGANVIRVRLAARTQVVVALAVGVAMGIVGASEHTAGLVVAAAVVTPFLVAATTTFAMTPYRTSLLLVVFASSYGVVVVRSPGITLFELLALIPAAWLVAFSARPLAVPARSRPYVFVFFASSFGLLALGALYSVWHPTHLGSSAPIKEFGKNLEITLLALATFAYTSRRERFARAYGVLALIAFVSMVEPVFKLRGNVFATDSLQTVAPLTFLALALPFVQCAPVALLIGVADVLLIVSRTRGAWVCAFVVAAVALCLGPARRMVGPVAVAALAASTLVVAVWSVETATSAKTSRAAPLVAARGKPTPPNVRARPRGPSGPTPALPASVQQRLTSLTSGHDQSINTRLSMLRASADEARGHPLTGVGPGNFKAWLLAHGSPVNFRIGLSQIPKDPHDAFAKFAAEMGFPGLALLLAWAFAVLAAPVLVARRLVEAKWHDAASDASEEPTVMSPAWDVRVLPYAVGLCLYAPVYLYLLLASEWGSLARVQLALGTGLLLSLYRLTGQRRQEVESNSAFTVV